MQTVRLYGNIAATFHYGKDTIRSLNGVIDVPAILVAQALALGFTREETGPAITAGTEPVAALPAGDVAPVSIPAKTEGPTLADKVALYEKEARDAGFEIEDIARIVQERLRYDDLIASGMSKDDVIATIWGPTVGDVSEVAAKSVRDALDAELEGHVDDRIKPPAAPETGEAGEGEE